jgi:hypothetical protein
MTHRFLTKAFAAAALATVFASASLSAQDTTRKVSKGEVATVDVATVIASLDSISAQIARFKALPAELKAEDVKILTVTSAPDDSTLNAAIERNRAVLPDLHKAIEANTAVTAALTKELPALSAKDVLSINVTGTGVHVYIRKA